jgi:MarR family transcriptional regulator, 2-MHQ and catechol-resistance regulon repressor
LRAQIIPGSIFFVDPVLRDERITAFGLLLEATTAVRDALVCAGAKWGGMPPSYELLMRLARSDGQRLRMSDLAAQCGLSPSGASRAVDRLAADGLVQRVSCPEDHRVAYAEITPKGNKAIVAALKKHVDDVQELFIDALSADERQQLETITRKLRDRHRPEYTAGAKRSD